MFKQLKEKKKLFSIALCLIIVLILFLFYHNKKNSFETVSITDFKLNTVVTITVYDSKYSDLLEESMDLCDFYESIFSRTLPSSEIYRLNHGLLPQQDGFFTLSSETEQLIRKGLEYSALSQGAFDLTIEPVSSQWDFTSDSPVPPSPDTIQTALPLVDYTQITLKDHMLHMEQPDMGIDAGAIAKGYIADRVKEFLVEHGVEHGIINLGGNVLCIGEHPSGKPFQIGIQQPFSDRNETVMQIPVSDYSVVTSGIYERSFRYNDVLYHHILNPKTGYPFDNQLLSVTILSPKSVDGDGLSTSCFALGLKKGMELINSIPDAEALFITADHQLHYSAHFPH